MTGFVASAAPRPPIKAMPVTTAAVPPSLMRLVFSNEALPRIMSTVSSSYDQVPSALIVTSMRNSTVLNA